MLDAHSPMDARGKSCVLQTCLNSRQIALLLKSQYSSLANSLVVIDGGRGVPFSFQFSHLKQQSVPFIRQPPVVIKAGGFTVLLQKPPRFLL